MNRKRKTEAADWVRDFLTRHIRRNGRPDWPPPGPALKSLADGWVHHFARLGITEAEADEASLRLMARPPDRVDQHLGRLLEIVEGMRSRARSNTYTPTSQLEESDPECIALLRELISTRGEEREAVRRKIALKAGAEIQERLPMGPTGKENPGTGLAGKQTPSRAVSTPEATNYTVVISPREAWLRQEADQRARLDSNQQPSDSKSANSSHPNRSVTREVADSQSASSAPAVCAGGTTT